MTNPTRIRTAVVPVAEIFELRRSVLRPGLPPESAVFPEDDDPAARTFHVAAYDEEGAVRACATFFAEPLPDGAGAGADGADGSDGADPARSADPGHAAYGAQAPDGADRAYRFRGMASDPAVRGLGYGVAVLRAGLAEAAARDAETVWCNGRTSARGFYEHQGFTAVGEEFDIESVGPHHVFVIKVG
ncbi:GNAT family N-acetyltransferase [Streptomyces varsoviensis]|uniref:GNAT family N-acetyltransferase n=1 Tax=Streptomyces varsoviensis TaxID=67373 RepID=UPI0033ED9129